MGDAEIGLIINEIKASEKRIINAIRGFKSNSKFPSYIPPKPEEEPDPHEIEMERIRSEEQAYFKKAYDGDNDVIPPVEYCKKLKVYVFRRNPKWQIWSCFHRQYNKVCPESCDLSPLE